jgi:rhodanese-related sulfurtransferase
MLGIGQEARAEEPKSKWDSLRFITTDELKSIYDAREDFLLINTLSPIEHAEIAIKGSVNIPYEYLARGTAKLPENKNKKLIFYCKGPK